MAENKKQHFVPRFYLKSFSIQTKINTFLLEKGLEVKGTFFESHCHETYFYGKDLRIEKSFSGLETAFSRILNTIIQTKELPNKGSDDYCLALMYLISQSARTRHSAEIGSNMVSEMVYHHLNTYLRLNGIDQSAEELVDISVNKDYVLLNSLQQSFLGMPLLFDLNPILIENKSNIPFITSDHPVVLSNPYFGKTSKYPMIGYQSRGLIILFPLSPRECIILYDREYYIIGGNQSKYYFGNDQDAIALNQYQIVNGHYNVFYSDLVESSALIGWYNEIKSKRPSQHAETKTISEKKEGKKVHQLINTMRLAPKFFPEISFIHIKNRSKKRSGERHFQGVRNPHMCEIQRMFSEAFKKKELDDSDWPNFLNYFRRFL